MIFSFNGGIENFIIIFILIVSLFVSIKIINNFINRRADAKEKRELIDAMEDELNRWELRKLQMEGEIRNLKLQGRDLKSDVKKISIFINKLESKRDQMIEKNSLIYQQYESRLQQLKEQFKSDSLKQLDLNRRLKEQYDAIVIKKIDAQKQNILLVNKNANVLKAAKRAKDTIQVFNRRLKEIQERDRRSNQLSMKNSFNYYYGEVDESIEKIVNQQIELVESGKAFDVSSYEILNETEFEKARREQLQSVNAFKMINYEFGLILNKIDPDNIEIAKDLANNIFNSVEVDFEYSPTVYVRITQELKDLKMQEIETISQMKKEQLDRICQNSNQADELRNEVGDDGELQDGLFNSSELFDKDESSDISNEIDELVNSSV